MKEISEAMQDIVDMSNDKIEKLKNSIYEKFLSNDVYLATGKDDCLSFMIKTKDGAEELNVNFIELSKEERDTISKGKSFLNEKCECELSPSEFLEIFSYEDAAYMIATLIENMDDVYAYQDLVDEVCA